MKVILPLENLQYDFPVPDQFNGMYHDSIAKVCPRCLRLWAIIHHRTKHFSIQGTICRTCWPAIELDQGANAWIFLWPASRGGIPGSLLDDCGSMGVQWELLDYLPQPLLEREFILHLKVTK